MAQVIRTEAHIHTLDGLYAEVEIVDRREDMHGRECYIAKYNGHYYTAIFNPFAGWYVDDKYGCVDHLYMK